MYSNQFTDISGESLPKKAPHNKVPKDIHASFDAKGTVLEDLAKYHRNAEKFDF